MLTEKLVNFLSIKKFGILKVCANTIPIDTQDQTWVWDKSRSVLYVADWRLPLTDTGLEAPLNPIKHHVCFLQNCSLKVSHKPDPSSANLSGTSLGRRYISLSLCCSVSFMPLDHFSWNQGFVPWVLGYLTLFVLVPNLLFSWQKIYNVSWMNST